MDILRENVRVPEKVFGDLNAQITAQTMCRNRLIEFLEDTGLDDLVDLACMDRAGVSCCPSDAVGEVRVISDFISAYPGGRGAVREIIEELLRSRGVWEKIVSEYKKTI